MEEPVEEEESVSGSENDILKPMENGVLFISSFVRGLNP